MNKLIVCLMLLLLAVPMAFAVDFDEEISEEDKDTFDAILEPVMKIYNFVKYSASVLAVLFLLFAGVSFIIGGKDVKKREDSKMMAMYVVVGLAVIWIAPYIVEFMVK